MQGVPDEFDDPRDRAVFHQPIRQTGLELYRARIHRHAFDPHLHDGYGIGMIEAGAQRFRYRGHEHHAPAGALVLMQPGELHTGRPASEQGMTYRMLYLDEPELRAQLGGAPAWHFKAAVLHDPALAQQLGHLIGRLWQEPDDLARDGLLAAALALLQPVVESTGAAPPASALRHDFQPVLRALGEDLARPWRLAELAALAGMSPSHFQRSFSARHQVSPHRYAMALRLAEAKRRLARGEAPADVATQVGLADQAHLTRRFAGMYGLTPGSYQKNLGLR